MFNNHLENKYILNKLRIKYITYDTIDFNNLNNLNNFNDLINIYKISIEIPPKFNQHDNRYNTLSSELLWKKKDIWLNKVYKIQKSNLIDVKSRYVWEGYRDITYHDKKILNILWDDATIYNIAENCLTPDENLYFTVCDLYLQLDK